MLSNQIAAGEVVQRPASVVKELVENSMDAGADQITVEIENGGKRLIRVSDNGSGLSRDDCLLAIERYATSKIAVKEDLFSIATFGFRGEALPSIASVSRFTLVSRLREAPGGTAVEISGGKLVKVSDAGAPPGTMVEVRQLFFNTPARRKFLKAESTEGSHISDIVAGLAMGRPDIGFRLFVNGKMVRHFPKGQDTFQRARLMLGADAAPHLLALELGENGITISGACAGPAVTRSTPNRLYYFVNRRLVKDPGLTAALFQGFRGRIMKGRYPLGVFLIDLPYEAVDVNVHPAKREIKFLDPQPVYQALAGAVASAMSRAQSRPLVYARSGPVDFPAEPERSWDRASVPAQDERISQDPGAALSARPQASGLSGGTPLLRSAYAPAREKSLAVAQPELAWGTATPRSGSPAQPGSDIRAEHQAPDTPPQVVGQVLGTYIVAEKDHCLVLVDQHAAHERITYEVLKRRHQGLGIQSQTLVVPEVVELTHREADLLEGILSDLGRLGVRVEPFGGTSFVIKAVPVLMEGKALEPFITEVVENLVRANEMGDKDAWVDDCLVTLACHRAIRANRSMNSEEMTHLLTELWRCENPMHCPHGRPILISFDAGQLEKLFKRVV